MQVSGVTMLSMMAATSSATPSGPRITETYINIADYGQRSNEL